MLYNILVSILHIILVLVPGYYVLSLGLDKDVMYYPTTRTSIRIVHGSDIVEREGKRGSCP